jgi:hypothetical protein
MDQSLMNFMTAVIAIGLAVSLPLMALMWVRFKTRAPRPGVLAGEIDEIHARLAELDLLQERLSEVEERLEFAERLLEQQREQPRLPERSEHPTPV